MAKSVNDKASGKTQAKHGRGLKNVRAPWRASKRRKPPAGAVSVKPGGRVRTFFREVRIEMSKVTWPPRKEAHQSTGGGHRRCGHRQRLHRRVRLRLES